MLKLNILLLLKAILILFVILFLGIPLAPDEAQYWTWSQNLDWGYYSKPPAIAWQIFVTTKLLGVNELGVRVGAIVLSFFIALATYALGKNATGSSKVGYFSAIVFAFSPAGMYLSAAATTDAGGILGLVLALSLLMKSIREKSLPPYFLIGSALLFGGLYKWTTFLFFPFFLPLLFFYPHLRTKGISLLFFFALLALLPSLYWNIGHDFATFKHVAQTNISKSGNHNFWSFLGAQIALFSPLFFFFYLLSYCKKKEGIIFCKIFASGILLFLFLALFKKMQPNWALFFYPAAMVLTAWYGLKVRRVWLYIATLLSLLIGLGAFLIPFAQQKLPLSYKLNPFRQSMGWDRLSTSLNKREYSPEEEFLFADTYQMVSLLRFYTQEKAYFFNLKGVRKNQFSYDIPLSYDKRKQGVFVVSENAPQDALGWTIDHYLVQLKNYCDHVEYLGADSLFEVDGKAVKHALFFRCHGYKGKLPQVIEKY